MPDWTVLIVDDHIAGAKTLQIALETLGFRAIAVSSAERALSLAGCEGVDVLITDYDIGYENGYCLCEEIRQLYPHVRTVLISGYDPGELPRPGTDFDLLLSKPLDLDRLEEALRRWRQDAAGLPAVQNQTENDL